jgi:hypothetical protein
MLGYVGLGSNIGDREAHLRAGLLAMAKGGVRPVAISSLWETEPVDGAGPVWFLNMVARVETQLSPGAPRGVAAESERDASAQANAPRSSTSISWSGDSCTPDSPAAPPHAARRFVPPRSRSWRPAKRPAALDDRHEARRAGKLALPESLPVYSRAL